MAHPDDAFRTKIDEARAIMHLDARLTVERRRAEIAERQRDIALAALMECDDEIAKRAILEIENAEG